MDVMPPGTSVFAWQEPFGVFAFIVLKQQEVVLGE
jgi:hypothetical protein